MFKLNEKKNLIFELNSNIKKKFFTKKMRSAKKGKKSLSKENNEINIFLDEIESKDNDAFNFKIYISKFKNFLQSFKKKKKNLSFLTIF